MKKIFKIMLVFLLSLGVKIKADYNAVGLNVDYNTVSKGDIINASLGYDTIWDEGVAETYYDESKEEYVTNILNGRNELETIYLTFDKSVFSLNDVSEFKLVNPNYKLESYETYNDPNDPDYIVYEFKLTAKELEDEEESYPIYDGKMDNIIFENLQFKVRTSTYTDEFFITSGHLGEDYKSYLEEDAPNAPMKEKLREVLPINVVEPKSKKGLEHLRIIFDNKQEQEIKLVDGVYEYEVEGSIDGINAGCYKKCYITNNGSFGYVDDYELDEKGTVTLKVKYEDNKTEKYVLKYKYNETTINFEETEGYVLVIAPNENKEYFDNIKKQNKNSVPVYTFTFDKLTDLDIELLEDRTEQSFNDKTKTYTYFCGNPYAIENKDGRVEKQYKKLHDKELTLEEIENEYESFNGNEIVNEEEKVVEEAKEESTKNKLLNPFVIGGISIIVIVIIVILIVINKNKKKDETNEKSN